MLKLLILTIFSWVSISYAALPTKIGGVDLSQSKFGTVVIFLSSSCPCSDSHISHIKDLQKEFSKFDFVAVHSNVDEKDEDGLTYFKKAALPFEVWRDKNAKIADEFKAFKTPHAFVVNSKGEILFSGGVTSSAIAEQAQTFHLKEALKDLSENKSVKNPKARPIGCAIARET